MKKTVYLVLALSLLLCSCSQTTDNDNKSKVNDSSTVVTTASTTMTTTTTSSSKVDENAEISAYYIHHWYGEEPYEITDKDTIHKITAWIENAKSVCKDYPYIDGLEYGGADAYGISLERMNQVMRMRAFVLSMFHSIRGTPQTVCTLKIKYAILA